MNPLKVKLYNFMDKIKNENNVESNITYNEGADIILLSYIEVSEGNKGIGTKIMKELCAIADSFKKDIVLIPTEDYGSEMNRLIAFYKRFNFRKDNSGKFFDNAMVRKHKG